jgi:hypothetical protein
MDYDCCSAIIAIGFNVSPMLNQIASGGVMISTIWIQLGWEPPMYCGGLISLVHCGLIIPKTFRSQKPDWNLVLPLVVFLTKD